MISNYVLRNKIDGLKRKRDALVLKKKELQQAFVDCGVSRNQAYKINSTGGSSISEGVILNRQRISKEMKNLEDELLQVNGELRKCHSEDKADRNNGLLEVFKEIFTQAQMVEIKIEAQRRMAGEAPTKVSFSVKDSIDIAKQRDSYRKLAKEQLEKMIEFRILLTSLIEQGCAKFGDAEFLKFISPLNRLIIPLAELEKIKRKENL